MSAALICDGIRTPIGKFAGGLSTVRTDDLAAIPLKAILERNTTVDPECIDEVILGCANQAGEDNRNVARMALLLAGLPETVPGVTINRLCGLRHGCGGDGSEGDQIGGSPASARRWR
jgi:acetyl-CoA acetyltransferase